MEFTKKDYTFKISPESKDLYKFEIVGTDSEAMIDIYQMNQNNVRFSYNKKLMIGGAKCNGIQLTNEQLAEAKSEMKELVAKKHEKTIEFFKNVDLTGKERINNTLVFLNDPEFNKIVDQFTDFDLAFATEAFEEYALPRFNEEREYYEQNGSMYPKYVYSSKTKESKKTIPANKKSEKQIELENEIYEAAETMTEEEFEDFYDLPRDRFL